MTEDVLWTEIDRVSYKDDGRYEPVNYTQYTGITLQQTLFVFTGLTALHFILNFIFKYFTSSDFKADTIFNQVILVFSASV